MTGSPVRSLALGHSTASRVEPRESAFNYGPFSEERQPAGALARTKINLHMQHICARRENAIRSRADI